MFILQKSEYSRLNAKQKENFNFFKVAARLADYGFNCIRLSDDYMGADFLAKHINGEVLNVQLKSRLTLEEKYLGKEIRIAFPYDGKWFMYPHDEAVDEFIGRGGRGNFFSTRDPSKVQLCWLSKYEL